MAQLPQELIVEILLWLPVKSLKRFRCLSKSLCAVIDSPDFINSHLNRSSQNFNLRKMLFPDISLLRFQAHDVNVDLHEEEEEVVLRTGRPVSTMTGRVCGGNCNGLLLFCQSVSRPFWFVLWNPSTRQFIELPDIPYEFDPFILNGSGLGLDDSTDDYKAILSVYFDQVQDNFEEIEVQFWIYSSRSSLWRRARNFPYHLDAVFDEKIGYFTDGSLHWICALGNGNGNHFVDRRKEIVAFDVRKETFSLVPQPAINSSVDTSVYLKLHLLEGCLCISYFYSSKPVVVDLFIRNKDDGDNQFSWTKLFSVTEPLSAFNIRFFRFMKVLRYSNRGDKILVDVGRKTFMVSYDLRKKSFRKVKVEIHRTSHCESPVVCLESLVPVVGGGA